MDCRQEYKIDIRITDSVPYDDAEAAAARIRQIHGAARVPWISMEEAALLWAKHFVPVWTDLARAPCTRIAYDRWIVRQIRRLASDLGHGKCLRVGIAQKMLNLFMKDLWAWRCLPSGAEQHLHIPIDRTMVQKLRKAPASWSSWTKVDVPPGQFKAAIRDYMEIQKRFRDYCAEIGKFGMPIEMEQFIWRRI